MDCEYDGIDDTHCVLKIGGTKEVALIVAKYGKLIILQRNYLLQSTMINFFLEFTFFL